jgi:hypothetical protein
MNSFDELHTKSNQIPSFVIAAILFFIMMIVSSGNSQNSDFSTEPLWMLILPGTISEYDDQTRENEITDTVAEIAWQSGRFEVFDRYDVRDLLTKYYPVTYATIQDSIIMKIGEDTECDEALIVDLLNFSQIGIPPNIEEEKVERNFVESIFDGLFGDDSEDYSDNIHTRLTVQFRNINLISGEEIDRFNVQISHTGGTKSESEESALEDFHRAVLNEMQMIYQLVTEVIAVDGLVLDLKIGSNLGLSGNTIFEIVGPNRIKIEDGEKVTSPGKPAGLACVQEVGDSTNRSHIIRQWDIIEPGYFANEVYKSMHGLQLFFLPEFPGEYIYIGAQFHYSPLAAWDFGGGLHYTNVTDSYKERNNGFGFGAFGSGRFISLTALMIHAKAGINFDIAFKKDDTDNTVTTGILSFTLGLSTSLMLTKKSDIELNVGYRLSTKSSDWSYEEDEEQFDAFWENEPPVVDLSGLYLTIGYKIIFF